MKRSAGNNTQWVKLKRYLRGIALHSFMIMVVAGLGSSLQAQVQVSGTVVDGESQEPLPGVNIVVQGNAMKGTTTNADGYFSLNLEEDEQVLIFSFLGFETLELDIESLPSYSGVRIVLQPTVGALDELVVIGYGTQKENEITSSIVRVSSEDIVKTPTSQAMQALQGKAPGVQVVNAGAPGSAPTVRIRGVGTFEGNASPLYVVDGMFFDNIDFLNTADIASISVLKDVSASAIYGVRAANGVVLIETKSGGYSQAPEVTYSGYTGIQVAQNVIKMANAEQFTNYVLDTGSAADASFIDAAFQRYGRSRINPNVPDVNTDWYDEVLKTAPIQNHSLSVSGGNMTTRYNVGLSYFNQEGLITDVRNEYERLNFRTKLDFDVSDRLKVGANVNISNATQYVAENSIWFQTYFAVPILPVFDDLNTAASPRQLGNAEILGYINAQNPFFNIYYNDNRNKIGKILANFNADYQIIPNKLTFSTAYNYNFSNFNIRNVDFDYNNGTEIFTSAIYRSHATSLDQIWDNYLTYEDNFGKHNITTVLGYSFRSETNEGVFARGTELSPSPDRDLEELWYISQATGGIDEGSTGDFGTRLFGSSYIARLAYNYDERYMLYSTYRIDGTNRFQEKWGNFFTFGAGWVVSEESFFKVPGVDYLKLRGGWGQLGNDATTPALGAPERQLVFLAVDDERVSGTVVVPTFDFVDRWETTEEINLGITSRFLNDRLSMQADYYVRDTKDAAVTIILPLIRENVRRNVASIRNSGFEMGMEWSETVGQDWSYSVGGNFATLSNEVLSLGGPQYLNSGQVEFRQRSIVGQPFQAFYGYETQGIYQNQSQITNSGLTQEFITDSGLEPGDFIFKDQNGDGIIDDADRVVLGSYLPDLTYGFNINVGYKNIAFSASFQGQSGNSILNRKRGEIIFTEDTNIDAELAENLWTGEGTSNKYPSAAGLRKGWNQNMSDYFVEDGSYFRIQNVQLSYTLAGKSLLGTELPETRITFTAERPLTVFDYNGFNPEVANGIDRQTYPIPAIYTVGLNLKF